MIISLDVGRRAESLSPPKLPLSVMASALKERGCEYPIGLANIAIDGYSLNYRRSLHMDSPPGGRR